MSQLIKITTVPIEYQFKVNDAKFEMKQGTAELEISRDQNGLQIKSRPVKINIDTFEARSSVSPTIGQGFAQRADEGHQAAYQATAQFAQEGKMLLHAKFQDSTLNQIAQNRVAKPTGAFGLEFLPEGGAKFDVEGAELEIQYQMDKLNFDAKIEKGTIEFVPGTVEFSVTQRPQVTVEYLGEPIYVPASAAEMFNGGKQVDVLA